MEKAKATAAVPMMKQIFLFHQHVAVRQEKAGIYKERTRKESFVLYKEFSHNKRRITGSLIEINLFEQELEKEHHKVLLVSFLEALQQ